jgi:hypothetical protein
VNLAEILHGYAAQQQKFRRQPVSVRAHPANEEQYIMNDKTKLPTAVPEADGFDPIVPSGQAVIAGGLLKFIDGAWSESGIKVPAGTKLLALSTNTVLQRWQDGRVVETINQKPLPDPADLSAQIPEKQWELGPDGNRRPPWQLTYVTYLLNPATCETFTVANSTIGTRVATQTLKDRVAWMRRLRGNHVVPEIELSSKPMKTRFGVKQRPEFKIVGWHLLGGGDTKAPEQLALPGLTPVTPPSIREELDDEIGF